MENQGINLDSIDPEDLANYLLHVREREEGHALVIIQAAASLSSTQPHFFEENIKRVVKALAGLKASPELASVAALPGPDSSA
jgi:hypothetical protein